MNRLAAFIRRGREEIIARWLERVEQLPSARDQSYLGLRDHVPDLLEQIALSLERGGSSSGDLDDVAGQHAVLRYHAGYDLRQVVLEYQVLRQTIFALYDGVVGPQGASVAALAQLDRAIDESIGDAIDRFMDERDRTRDTFVGILGHDLRNPLAAISQGATALLDRAAQLDDVTVRVARAIGRASQRMDKLILDVLDFARARLGSGIPIAPAWVDLRPVLASVVEELVTAHPERTIEHPAELATGDLHGEWDASRVAQAVSNLIGNAIVHGQDPIVVDAVDEGALLRIEVRNQGLIAPDAQPTMFQPFHSGRGTPGLGLGLYVVDEIARAHRGWVEVRSTAEEGTRFTIVLPRRAADAPAQPRRT